MLKLQTKSQLEAERLKLSFSLVMLQQAKQITEVLTLKQIEATSRIIPHIEEVATHYAHILADDEFWFVFNIPALFYQGQRLYGLAEYWYYNYLQLADRRLDSMHLDIASSLYDLAVLYFNQGKYSKAEPLYERALDIRRSRLDKNHPSLAAIFNNLGALYLSQRKYSEAEPLLKSALTIRMQLFKENHPDVATSLNNLAMLYKFQYKYTEAEELCERALNICERQLGTDHPLFATNLDNLAIILHCQCRHIADCLLKNISNLETQKIYEYSPVNSMESSNIATLYYDLAQRYIKTATLYERALDIRMRQLGEEHPDTAISFNNLGSWHSDLLQYSEAEIFYKRALDIRIKQLGEEHPDTAISFNDLANTCYHQAKYVDAQKMYAKALHFCELTLGRSHPTTVNIQLNSTECLQHAF
jgi:tetratricopeptide (TPR) repeat protein